MRCCKRPNGYWRRGLAIAAIGLGLLAMAPAGAQSLAEDESQAFTLRNLSTAPVNTLHVSPDFRSTWGADRLGTREVQPGSEVRVDLGSDAGNCFFDVQVGDTDGRQREYWGVNLCTQRTLDVR